jgi:hypothetical protein
MMDDVNEYEPNPEQDTPSVNGYPSGSSSAHTPAAQTIADSLASMQIDEGRANHIDPSNELNGAPKKKTESKKIVSTFSPPTVIPLLIHFPLTTVLQKMPRKPSHNIQRKIKSPKMDSIYWTLRYHCYWPGCLWRMFNPHRPAPEITK